MNLSVIVPTYNSAQFLGEALESVFRQTVRPKEVICIDDASTDSTVGLIQSAFPQVSLFRNNKNEGPSFSRNVGIENSTGEFIAFLDSDDCWLPDKTQSQLNEFSKDNFADIVAGQAEYFLMPGCTDRSEEVLLDRPHFNAYLSGFMFKRNVFTKIGKFDINMRLSEDHDLLLRAREAGIKIKIMGIPVFRKRIHDDNATRSLSFRESGMIKALRNSLERRRLSGTLQNIKPIKPE